QGIDFSCLTRRLLRMGGYWMSAVEWEIFLLPPAMPGLRSRGSNSIKMRSASHAKPTGFTKSSPYAHKNFIRHILGKHLTSSHFSKCLNIKTILRDFSTLRKGVSRMADTWP